MDRDIEVKENLSPSRRGNTHPGGHYTAPSTERRAMSRWEFRADQVQLLYKQVQIELFISILVTSVVTALFWKVAPPGILFGWSIATIITVGGRSLFISSKDV
ncbi:MAG: hypothetical protein KAI15_02005, partial [Gammaproteobacteria bacterium]|nr:hypothetical protein [Gammaproteobacteria bacterium]